jgi:hypothetical protein
MPMRRVSFLPSAWPLAMTLVALLGACSGTGARADLILNLACDVGASIEFEGSGTGATIIFDNNKSGTGFHVTSSTGVEDSVGLHGTIGGSFSYTKASITHVGPWQDAPATVTNGVFTITDAAHHSLIGAITGLDLATLGTGGALNVSGGINLSNVVYSGTNADLKKIRDQAEYGGGVLAITFQFLPARSLTALTAKNSDFKTSYSGSLLTQSIPEPSAGLLAGTGILCLLGYGLRWRRAAA